ncbi:MAG: hypothetical protein IJT35_06235 [Paludibacteraceae bacterium]|nr:hypothetical protein [Paludibacteraceae bacterium]
MFTFVGQKPHSRGVGVVHSNLVYIGSAESFKTRMKANQHPALFMCLWKRKRLACRMRKTGADGVCPKAVK